MFFLSDPPSYNGGAAITGYIMEMENPGTKGQNDIFFFFFCVFPSLNQNCYCVL